MPPRKRKVQQVIPAIPEDQPKAEPSSKPEEKLDSDTKIPGSKESVEEQVQATVKEYKEKVDAKAKDLRQESRQRVQALRADADAIISKSIKQVRQLSAADFLMFTPEQGASGTLHNVLLVLLALQQGSNQTAMAAATAATQQVGAAAPAGPSTRARDDEPEQQTGQQSAAQPQQTKQQQVEITEDVLPRHNAGQQWEEPPLQQNASGAANTKAFASSPSIKLVPACTLMPPPPPRLPLSAANPPVRHLKANEGVVFSANGSPIHLGGLLGPAALAKGAGPNLTDATPAIRACSIVAPPPTIGFTGYTFRRAAPTRGRTKQPTLAITVTTQDGKQFTVDDLIGLAGVPQAYREEVRRLMEAEHQDFSKLVQTVETLEQNDAAAAPGTSRSARRR